MAWNLDSDRPIFLQIVEKIQSDIVSGYYPPGEKLPSVRELAQMAAVNPNTVQKAYSELERTGLIFSKRTSGRYITQDKELIEDMKKNLAKGMIYDFLEKMAKLGFDADMAIALTKIIQKEDREDE